MGLDVTTAALQIAEDLAPRGLEAVADRYIQVLVGFAFDDDLVAGQADVDTDVIQVAVLAVAVRGFNQDNGRR
ncbi:MAG: hypothetical protein HY940_09120 [Gammaproteobacteria bacterium]|nr:hypothetical protein [Gammaproteobacteria bacterium]